MRFTQFLQAIALCGSFFGFGSTNASPLLFDSVGDTGSIVFSTVHDGATLSAPMGFLLTSLSATSATFGLTVANNSTGPGKNTLTSFGIDVVSPKLKTASATDNWDVGLKTTLPSFGKVDLCVWIGKNCSGAGNQGLGEGEVNHFFLTLTTAGDFLKEGILFTDPYGVKFQSVGTRGGSFEFTGTGSGCTPHCDTTTTTIAQVPEPDSIALLGLGLLGVSLARRRKS